MECVHLSATKRYARTALPVGQPCNPASTMGIRLLRTTGDSPVKIAMERVLREAGE
jgi:hypothetical protein